jgi:hypothetical protein
MINDPARATESAAMGAVLAIRIQARASLHLLYRARKNLAATAIPLDPSGLETKDIEKVCELQRKVVEDTLNRASDTVWQALDQLREQVNDPCRNSTGKDTREILQRLLWMIDEVCNLDFPGSEGPSQSEPAGEQRSQNSGGVARCWQSI